MNETQKIPWKRISVEATAIVASILLAFGIDAWWENRGDRQEEERLLNAVRQELVENNLRAQRSIKFQSIMIERSIAVLQAYADQLELSDKEIDELLAGLMWSNTTYFQNGVVQGLIQSGKLSLIQNESLQNQIASIDSQQKPVVGFESKPTESFAGVVMPYLIQNTSIPQLSNSQDEHPLLGGFLATPLPVRQARSHRNVLESEEFAGIVTSRYWEQIDIIGILERYLTFANNLMASIDDSLAEMSQ